MDYPLQFRKFISSQYLYTGVRITAGVLIPAFLLYQFGLLVPLIGIPLGALFVSLTDNAGPINYRRNGMLVSILLNFVVLVITGFSRGHPVLITAEIIGFGLAFSLIAVFGNRANSIGLVALLVFILNIDAPVQNVWQQAFYFSVGGIWYALLSLVLYTIRPYRMIQQLLGEYLMEIAEYLNTKKLFYQNTRNLSRIYQQLMQYQVKIHNHMDQLREMLFTTRRYFSESTAKGRVLMMLFLDSIDLMERIMTSQQDYELLHKEFDHTGMIDRFEENIGLLADELHHIGLAVQSGQVYKSTVDLNAQLQHTTSAFLDLRESQMNAQNVEGFIRLRQILYSLQDITERIKRLELYTTYDKKISKQYKKDEADLEKFISTEKINLRLLLSNFSLKSAVFRYSVRMVVALLAGYIVSLLYPLGHGYWILLTIAVIMKPAYSITRQRNVQRVTGTFIGAGLGFGVLFLTNNNGVLFVVMLMAMVIAYSLLKLNYTVSSSGITLYVLLNFHFLSPAGFHHLLLDRIIDTGIGSAIAFVVSNFVLPAWEHEKIDEYALAALKTNSKYFQVVSAALLGKRIDATGYKMARKDAFVALANFSDNFQRMLSEPKSRQPNMDSYHQFVVASHMLTSYIASLAYYAERSEPGEVQEDFLPMAKQIDQVFDKAIRLMENNEWNEEEAGSLPMNEKVLELLEQRRKELEAGVESTQGIRKKLSDLKTIAEQFQLIHSNLAEQLRILQKIKRFK